MFISFIHYGKKEESNDASPSIHPFYKDSFTKLYGISKNELKSSFEIPTEWILSTIKRTLANIKTEPEFFFDVRSTEDFSSPAPEYVLLHQLNLKHTSPLSIKGMGSLSIIQALQISDLYLTEFNSALFCIVEEYHRYDKEKKPRGYVASFILSKLTGELEIEDYGFFESKQDLIKYLSNEKFDIIYTEPNMLSEFSNATSLNVFLTDTFLQLSNIAIKDVLFRTICISQYQDMYGYYVIRKAIKQL